MQFTNVLNPIMYCRCSLKIGCLSDVLRCTGKRYQPCFLVTTQQFVLTPIKLFFICQETERHAPIIFRLVHGSGLSSIYQGQLNLVVGRRMPLVQES
jgi:hypothetical protein